MDDEVRVGVGDGVAGLQEERDPVAEAEAMRVRIGRDGLAVDQLHRQEGGAVGREAAVEQARHAGVVEPGEQGALAQEAWAEVGAEAGVDELEGGVLREGVVGALGAVDAAHAAAPEQPRHAPRADLLADGGVGRVEVVVEVVVGGASVRVRSGRSSGPSSRPW